jgi:chaperonin GroEL (HSP60 family)
VSKRSKAYLAAAEYMAEVYGYTVTLDPESLKNWIQGKISDYRDEWDFIWKAARRAEWEHSQEDQNTLQEQVTKLMLKLEQTEGNLTQAIQTSKNRGDIWSTLATQVNDLKTRNEAQRKSLEEGRMRAIRTLQANTDLRQENERLKKELVERTLPTYESLGLKQKLEESGRLYTQVEKELRYTENALLLSEQERSDIREKLLKERDLLNATKPAGEGWDLSWVRLTGASITGTVKRSEPTRCNATDAEHRHDCILAPGAHRNHQCHCGHIWSNSIGG